MKDHEVAVKAFQEADEKFWKLCNAFLDGSILFDLFNPTGNVEAMVVNYQAAMARLDSLREDRNSKLTTAANALRQSALIPEGQWRGPDGKSTVIKAGPFVCSSVTKRSLDVESLFDLAKKRGIFERLLQLKGIDTNGREYNLVQQTWDIEYEGVKKWLQQNELDDVLKGAYDERESTPQCKGPKQVANLGEDLK